METCIVHGCGRQADVEVTWAADTRKRLGWAGDMPETRRYCRRCFDSKSTRYPWTEADTVRRITPPCPACGKPMTDILAGAIACAPGGRQVDVGSAFRCTDRTCQEQRDEAALANAVARGVINP